MPGRGRHAAQAAPGDDTAFGLPVLKVGAFVTAPSAGSVTTTTAFAQAARGYRNAGDAPLDLAFVAAIDWTRSDTGFGFLTPVLAVLDSTVEDPAIGNPWLVPTFEGRLTQSCGAPGAIAVADPGIMVGAGAQVATLATGSTLCHGSGTFRIDPGQRFYILASLLAFQVGPGFTDATGTFRVTLSPDLPAATQALAAAALRPVALGAVPEPASWVLLIAGFGLIGTAARRRRHRIRCSRTGRAAAGADDSLGARRGCGRVATIAAGCVLAGAASQASAQMAGFAVGTVAAPVPPAFISSTTRAPDQTVTVTAGPAARASAAFGEGYAKAAAKVAGAGDGRQASSMARFAVTFTPSQTADLTFNSWAEARLGISGLFSAAFERALERTIPQWAPLLAARPESSSGEFAIATSLTQFDLTIELAESSGRFLGSRSLQWLLTGDAIYNFSGMEDAGSFGFISSFGNGYFVETLTDTDAEYNMVSTATPESFIYTADRGRNVARRFTVEAGEQYEISLTATCLSDHRIDAEVTMISGVPANSLTSVCDAAHSVYWNGVTDIRGEGGEPLVAFDLGATGVAGNYLYASPQSPSPANAGPFLPGAVPEPASWALLIAGFGLTGSVARRRRSVHGAPRTVPGAV